MTEKQKVLDQIKLFEQELADFFEKGGQPEIVHIAAIYAAGELSLLKKTKEFSYEYEIDKNEKETFPVV